MNNHPIAFFLCDSNTIFSSKQFTSMLSSPYAGSHQSPLYLNEESIRRSISCYSFRRLVIPNWKINHNVFLSREDKENE